MGEKRGIETYFTKEEVIQVSFWFKKTYFLLRYFLRKRKASQDVILTSRYPSEVKGRADTLAEGPKPSQPLNTPLMLGITRFSSSVQTTR